MNHPWMLDELGHAGDEHLDASFVVGYDRKQGPVPDEAAAADIPTLREGGLGEEATRNSLHQLPDFWKALALTRIGDILRPGGLLLLHDLIYDFQPQEAGAVFDAWLAQAADDPARGYTSEDLAEHIRSEYSTFRWLLEPMLVAAGFEIIDASYRGAVYGAYTCVRR